MFSYGSLCKGRDIPSMDVVRKHTFESFNAFLFRITFGVFVHELCPARLNNSFIRKIFRSDQLYNFTLPHSLGLNNRF